MKIVILLSYIDQTGLTTNTLDLANALSELGHDVHVISTSSVEHSPGIANLREKFRTGKFEFIEYRSPRIHKFVDHIYLLLRFLFKILILNADIIHVESPYLSFIPKLLRKKFVSTIHVNDLVRSFKYPAPNKVVAISRETVEYGEKILNFNPNDIRLVFNGVDKRFAHLDEDFQHDNFKIEHNIPLGKQIIGFVGSIEKRKGHDILIQAISRLPESIRKSVHVVFVGDSKDKKTYEWLNQILSDYCAFDLVTVITYTDPKPFYDIFDLFVFPSRLEGFGLVVVEAMLSACCVVRSDTQGAYDQIENNVDGFVFKNENVEQLSEIIENLILDPTTRRRIAERGRIKALESFTAEVMARKTLAVYQEVITK